jgi:hypothetical protein
MRRKRGNVAFGAQLSATGGRGFMAFSLLALDFLHVHDD